MKKSAYKKSFLGKALIVIGYIISVFLVMIFVVNATMIVKSYIHPDKIPDFLGYKPFIVLSGSMEPAIQTGDLIVTRSVAPEKIQVGDVISFREEENVVVSHRVTEIDHEGGLSFLTKGDANVGTDPGKVEPEQIEGLFKWRVAGVGRFAIFLQTPVGMLIFIVAPLFLFILYTLLSRNRRGSGRTSREAELEAEIAALKAVKGESSNNAPGV